MQGQQPPYGGPGYPPQQPYHQAPQGQQGHPQGYPPQGYPPQGYPPQGYPPQGPQGYAPAQSPRPVKLTAGLYITFYVLLMLVGGVLVALGSDGKTKEVVPAIPLPFIVLGILQLVFMYKMYAAINDGVTRPTPGLAVGLMFIPFFSIVWVFIVWGKYPGQYNAFLQRHRIAAEPLTLGLYVCALVLGFIPVVGLVLWCIVLGKTAGAVNRLATAPRH